MPGLKIVGIIFSCLISILHNSYGQDGTVAFNRDVRPILSDRCFLCHGPDRASEQSKATDLRLDNRASAIELDVFDFDEPAKSELIVRITSVDPDTKMPPPDSQKHTLSDVEVEILSAWIEEGAKYERHWSYRSPQRPRLPEIKDSATVFNAIDTFVVERLKLENQQPSAVADRSALIRRVTFDLTGLPPSVSEIEAFENDEDPLRIAYEKVIDRLLSSTHYGEQMARFWLDSARYADTSGYQYDRERKQWVWRDWVINAFNTNMPFDQFTIEQIAGDLLPKATDQTRLATGFNRNHPITIEGGVVDEEYRTEYVIDRVVTASTVWLGQTFTCARCHDHKYDPVSQEDFYRFYAFFNNVPERGLNGFTPNLVVASPLNAAQEKLEKRVAKLEEKLAELKAPINQWESDIRKQVAEWEILRPVKVVSSGGATPKTMEDHSVLMVGKNPLKDDYEFVFKTEQSVAAIRLEAMVDPSLVNGSASRGFNGNYVLSEFVVEVKSGDGASYEPVKISSASADYEQKRYTVDLTIDGRVDATGWAVDGNTRPDNRVAMYSLETPIPPGMGVRIKMLHRYGGSHQIGKFRISASATAPMVSPLEDLLAIDLANRSVDQTNRLRELLVIKFGSEEAREIVKELQFVRAELKKDSIVPATMVMQEMPQPRPVYVLERGEYDKPNKERPVSPGVPSAIGTLDVDGPQNRLGLARWLVSSEQPLTARVTVNRFWQRLFGVGIVKTSEDFGAQGEYPSHPDLLDWLAVEFMESGWDVKAILKTIVSSRTYMQSSRITEANFQWDPENRFLARGPRVRLDAEEIRDNALAVSGLLDGKIGGASVYPYHPQGLWMEVNNRPGYSRSYPHQTRADQLLRRTLYTFWKRTVPPPSMATFDAPSREYCVVRRSSTNTPLQALVMLHDPQFVESARFLGKRMLDSDQPTIESKIAFGFKCCTSREPTEPELEILLGTYHRRLDQYRADLSAADQTLGVGGIKITAVKDRAKLAALTQVARMLMNLSEFLTKG
ncbi:PSD1 and planctomycete cytochrome C domain-containing protein [Mariniblastus sp.]|nr:PSD1 and planctomycete cytochrome C domain-containing protein [Mariniblastus sp.]